MLMSDKVGILSEKIITARREHYIVVKRINRLRSIKILNVDTPNKRVAIHVKQKLIKKKNFSNYGWRLQYPPLNNW